MLRFPFFFPKANKSPQNLSSPFPWEERLHLCWLPESKYNRYLVEIPTCSVSRAQTHTNTPSRRARPTHPCSCDLTLTHIYSMPPPAPRQYNTDLVLWPHSDTVMCIHPSPLNLTYTRPYTPHTASRRPCVSCICKEPCACTLTYSHPLSLQARPQGPPPSLIHHAFRRSPKTWCPDLTTIWL